VRPVQRVAERRALGDAEAEPPVKAISPPLVLAEDIADMPGIGLPGGQICEEIALGESITGI
jgi:hypothetical protein